ncbi:UDP-N-acetylmuramate dehydrogenase [Nocardiopsis ansamitocini]|uniref:UDP-N-acetylmuramate dehydrogenase n=1 Tax=Nocardiopsis ansamitocini TaxID=1670832 RepID=UPI002552BAD8|nr:UDP-N-acetylmuramate dehydrogenase [Nocardiopsis ansamitocini]
MSAAIDHNVPLGPFTTLGVGGPADVFRTAADTAGLIEVVREADSAGTQLLILGGGSNLVVSDEGVRGTVVLVESDRTGIVADDGTTVRVRVDAGVEWDAFVRQQTGAGLSGLECLCGIPGKVGSTPIQNVGAYGQDVSQSIVEVVVYDRESGRMRAMDNDECGFTYRDSAFKGHSRYVVCEVVFELTRSDLSTPIRYAELARFLGVETGERVPLATVPPAVLQLRRSKGMVVDPADPDSHSAGSFFTNPILSTEEFADFTKRAVTVLGPDVQPPVYPAGEGRVKLSAAWLIERAGFAKGHGTGPARISTKHTLALTNPGGATTADLLELAREVRAGVGEAFGVTLVNEPVMVGVSL